jgi:hypothetical protein
MTTVISVRAAALADVDAIWTLQCECYPPALCESREVLSAIVAHGMSSVACAGGKDGGDDEEACVGYLLCHPTRRGDVPPLHQVPPVETAATTGPTNATRSWIFLRDLAVGARARCGGVGSSLVRAALSRDCRGAQLISVNGTEGFWRDFGFMESRRLSAEQVAHYGGGRVTFMERVTS